MSSAQSSSLSSLSLSSTSLGPMYGQVVVGPPGSGKTTYCNGMQQYLQLIGRNPCYVINLDPANEASKYIIRPNNVTTTKNPEEDIINDNDDNDNDNDDDNNPYTSNQLLPYNAVYDICEEVINITSVMEQTKLGPNGGLVYCMEYIEQHMDTIVQDIYNRIVTAYNHHNTSETESAKTAQSKKKTNTKKTNTNPPTTKQKAEPPKASSTTSPRRLPYLIFDLPGQVELYTHSTTVQRIIHTISKVYDIRLTAVQLIDSQYCMDITKFISCTLLGTTTMIRLELPTVNVLSKIDLLQQYGSSSHLPMQLKYFLNCYELYRLIPFLSIPDDERITTANEDDDDNYYSSSDPTNNHQPSSAAFDYTEDPHYQAIRKKRLASKFHKKYTKLHTSIAEVVDDFGLLSFLPLDINDAESVGRVVGRIDKANGYLFLDSTLDSTDQYANLFNCAVQATDDIDYYDTIADIQERIANTDNNFQQEQVNDPTPIRRI